MRWEIEKIMSSPAWNTHSGSGSDNNFHTRDSVEEMGIQPITNKPAPTAMVVLTGIILKDIKT